MNILILIPFGAAALDQWIKRSVRRLPGGSVFFRIPGLVEFVPSVNTGAAFSFLSGKNAVLILISAALILILAAYVKKAMRLTKPAAAACMFLLGGGIGNLIDRVLFGGVTDYIRILLFDFPIFNLADVFITCSVFVLIILLLTNRLEETTGDKHG